MLIGIMADTHNEIELARKAIQILKSRKVGMIIHAGDLTSSKMLELFSDLNCKFVLGNGDLDIELINQKSGELGFGCIEAYCEFSINEKKFLVFHGDDVPLYRKAVTSGNYDYIIKGHTHFFENYTLNNTHIINPGTLFGGDKKTIAVLDTETDKVEKIRVEEEE